MNAGLLPSRPFPRSALAFAAMLAVAGCPAAPNPDDDPGTDAGPHAEPDAPPVDCDVPFTSGVSMLAGCSVAGNVDGPPDVARLANSVNVAYRGGILYVAD